MPDLYTLNGNQVTGYMAYRDLATGAMLVAEPGQAYEIQGISLEDPVPPADGRWIPAPAAPPAGKTVPPAAPASGGDVTVEGPTAVAGAGAPPPADAPQPSE